MTDYLQLADIICLLLLSTILHRLLRSNDQYNRPPIVWTSIPWIGGAVGFLFRRVDFLNDCRSRYGPIYKLVIPGRRVVVVSSPTIINNMVETSPKVFRPPEERALKHIADLSDRLPYIAELLHKTSYLFMTNGFAKRGMGTMAGSMARNLYHGFQSIELRGDASMSLEEFGGRNLYCAASTSFLGSEFVLDLFDDFIALDRDMFFIANQMSYLSPRACGARARMVAAFEPYVFGAWESGRDGHVDGASRIICDSLREFRKGGLTVPEASRLLVTVLWGFNSNIIRTACNALAYLLSDSPTYFRVASCVQEGIDKNFADLETFLSSGLDNLDSEEFDILDSIIRETLRMTALPTSFRVALCDTFIKGEKGSIYLIKKGEYVVADILGMHYDPRLFPDPEKFLADRFVKHNVYGAKAIRPWGGGAYICKGRDFAHFAVKIFLLQALYIFDFVPHEGTPSLEANFSLTVARLAVPPLIRLRKRNTA